MTKASYFALPLLTALVASQASADTSSAFDGFYLGATAGVAAADVKVDRDRTSVPSDAFKLSARGAQGGLLVGFGKVLPNNKVYLGLEANGQLSNLKDKNATMLGATTSLTTQVHMKNSFGLAARIGTLFGQILGYAKLGVVSSMWQATSTAALGLGPTITTEKSSKRLTGFEAGLGLAVPLAKQVSLGGEYSFVNYRKLGFTHVASNTITHSIKPQTHAFSLRLAYKF